MSFWVTTKRVARYGFIGFMRNGFVSLSAVLVMTITLFVFASLIIGGAALSAVLKDLTGNVDVTVYFTPDATQDQIQQLQSSLSALPQVSSVTAITPDQELAAFQARHQNDQVMMQALDELSANPFGPALEVKAKDTSQYATIANYVSDTQKNNQALGAVIDKINYFQNQAAIDRLNNIIETSRRFGIAIAIVLGLSSLLIVFNTIRLAIYTAREEIGIMNVVGASRWYVRGPFLIAGLLYGFLAGILVLLILYPLTAWIGPDSQKFLGVFNVFGYYTAQFPMIFLSIVGSGMVLGAISSYLAIRRYLNA